MFSRWEYHRWRQRRRRRRAFLLLAALAVGAGVSAAGQYASHPQGHEAKTRHHPTPRRTVRAKGHTSTRTSSAELRTAGTGLQWFSFHGIDLPTSPQDGPHHTNDGLAWGYTDTPRGALLAAINIGVRTAALWGPSIFAPTIHRQVTGPDASALLKADDSGYSALRAASHVRRGQPAGRGYAVEAAFRFDSYTPAAATVDIVTEGPGTGGRTVMAATRVQVAWQRGDWRVLAPPGGDWGNSATTITSLTGYTTFTTQG
jgi:hypothetical protein